MERKRLWIAYLIIALVTLPFLVLFAQKAQQYLSRAGGVTASIVVDLKSSSGILPRPWSALAQGGEENPPMLKSVVSDIKQLSPTYIRLDHIYDLYSVVSKAGGSKLTFDFSTLDDTVNDVLSTGALPFFSLSYMPPSLTTDGSVTSSPSSWNEWEQVVQTTIEHYSGVRNKNLQNIYYEVWNEPDLFGKWGMSSDKDYRMLYLHSVTGALAAQNVNTFFIGGPSLTSLNSNWINDFVRYVHDNSIRLDFLTWHRYNYNPLEYASDSDKARSILANYPKLSSIPLIITEWGIDSENNPFYDNQVAAAHTVASVRQMLDKVNMAFLFEIKDGPPPQTSAFWGRWGLITHDNAGLYKKPRYHVLLMLNKLTGKRLSVSGEGSWVNGFASYDGDIARLILSNYDSQSLHSENVPVTFTNLTPSSYLIKSTYLNGTTTQNEYVVTSGSVTQNILFNPNDVVLVELTKTAPLAAFTKGPSGNNNDQAIVLSGNELIFSDPSFKISSAGSISFDLKPNWAGDDSTDRVIFDIPLSSGTGPLKHLTLKKTRSGFSNKLVFGVFDEITSKTVSYSIDNWSRSQWQKLELKWNSQQLAILINGAVASETQTFLTIGGGSSLTFFPSNAALDNLRVKTNGQEILKRTFNGSVDQ